MDSQELANYVLEQQINYNQKIIFFISVLCVYVLYYLVTKKYQEDFFIMDVMHKIIKWSSLPIISFMPLYVLLLDNGFDFYILSNYLIYFGGFIIALFPLIFLSGLGEKIYKYIKNDFLKKIINHFYNMRR